MSPGTARDALLEWLKKSLPYAGARHDREEWIARARGGAAVQRLNIAPVARLAQVAFDEPRMSSVPECLPDRYGFSRKAPIRKGNDQWPTVAHDAPDVAQHLYRLDKILDGDADHCRVERCVVKREARVAIEVLDGMRVESRIGGEFFDVHPDAVDPAVRDFRRQVADPTTHEIEHRARGRQQFAIELRHRRYRGFIDVGDKPRLAIEKRIRDSS